MIKKCIVSVMLMIAGLITMKNDAMNIDLCAVESDVKFAEQQLKPYRQKLVVPFVVGQFGTIVGNTLANEQGYYNAQLWNLANAEFLFERMLNGFNIRNPSCARHWYAKDVNVQVGSASYHIKYNPLMIAAHLGSQKYVNEFIKGCDVNATTDFGITALYEACRSGNINIIKQLLDKGAIVTENCVALCELTPTNESWFKNYQQEIKKMLYNQAPYAFWRYRATRFIKQYRNTIFTVGLCAFVGVCFYSATH